MRAFVSIVPADSIIILARQCIACQCIHPTQLVWSTINNQCVHAIVVVVMART